MDVTQDARPVPDNSMVCSFGSITVFERTVECDYGSWWLWQTRWSWFDATTTVPGQAGLYWKPADVTLPLVIPARPARTDPALAVTVNGPDGAWQRCVVPVATFEELVAAGRYVEGLDRRAAAEQERVGFQPAVRQYG